MRCPVETSDDTNPDNTIRFQSQIINLGARPDPIRINSNIYPNQVLEINKKIIRQAKIFFVSIFESYKKKTPFACRIKNF